MKMFKWLGGFSDPTDADEFLHKQAKWLTKMGMAEEFSLAVRTNKDGVHNVELWKKSNVDFRKSK